MARSIGSEAGSPDKYVSAPERKGGPFQDYEIRDALRTLADAEKIKRNSKLLAACKKEAGKQLDAARKTHSTLTGAK